MLDPVHHESIFQWSRQPHLFGVHINACGQLLFHKKNAIPAVFYAHVEWTSAD